MLLGQIRSSGPLAPSTYRSLQAHGLGRPRLLTIKIIVILPRSRKYVLINFMVMILVQLLLFIIIYR